MGSGTWTTSAFANYTTASKAMNYDDYVSADNLNLGAIYKEHRLNEVLNPHNAMRECCDSDEHPNTVPVILALDVTGSMGSAAIRVAQRLNEIMTRLYESNTIKDIEFCVMGIGDLECDSAPIQMSQFESDVRIAQQVDKIYFEGGGGGNTYESYTAAWYMGLNHTNLDCWKRGRKGIIITLGDECPNPNLPATRLGAITGDKQISNASVQTETLLEAVREKYDVYHIAVNDKATSWSGHDRHYNAQQKWIDLLGADNFKVSNLDGLTTVITDFITRSVDDIPQHYVMAVDLSENENGEIVW